MSQTPYPTCRQVMASGFLCGSPALKNQIFCHHHQRDRQRKANLRAGLAAKFRHGDEDFNAEIVASLDLPAPDDPEAALVCLSNTFLALAAGAIPEKRAALMIYNLQTVNSAFANLLRYRAQASTDGTQAPVERAVTDPEPIASFLMSHRQADFDFSAQQYVQRLETEVQQQTQRREDAEDLKQRQMPTADDTDKSTDQRGLEAAFNADAARMQALEHGDLARPVEAPHSSDEVNEAVQAMTSDDWEKYIERLWLNGAITSPQRDKLHARIFHADRNVRAAARFLALKYAPEKVKSVLGTQYPVLGKTEEQIA